MSFAFVAVGPLSESPFLAFPLSEARHGRGGLRRRFESETRKQWRKLINSSVVFYGKKQWGATIYPWTMKAGVVSGADFQPSGKALYNSTYVDSQPWSWLLNNSALSCGSQLKKHLPMSGATEFKPVLFKGQLYTANLWVPELRVLNPLSHKTFQHLCDLASLNPSLQVRKQAQADCLGSHSQWQSRGSNPSVPGTKARALDHHFGLLYIGASLLRSSPSLGCYHA